MKINSISLFGTHKTSGQKIKKDNSKNETISQPRYELKNMPFFTAGINKKQRKTIKELKEWHIIKKYFTEQSKEIYQNAKKIAISAHSKELEVWHLHMALLLKLKEYINEVEISPSIHNTLQQFKFPFAIEALCPAGSFSFLETGNRNTLKKIIDKNLKMLKKDFVDEDRKKYPKALIKNPLPSKDLINSMTRTANYISSQEEMLEFFDSYFMTAVQSSQNKKNSALTNKLYIDLLQEFSLDNSFSKQKGHLKFYDEKADTIWKNISIGNNVLILSNDGTKSSNHLISSFINLINKPGNEYRNISPDNLSIMVFNTYADFTAIENILSSIEQNKDPNKKFSILIFDFDTAVKNSGGEVPVNFLKKAQMLNNDANKKKIKFIFKISPENYYLFTENEGYIKSTLTSCAKVTLPSLNADDAKKYLTDESGKKFIEEKIKKTFTKDAILKAVDITNFSTGAYPDKALEILDSAAKYFIDKKEISAHDIDIYINETKNLNEKSNQTDDITIIYDTKKTLDDIKGSPMTKEQAASIVKQIQSGNFKTKGYYIFSSNGASGGGRRHCAEAIAGEAKIPMIIINAREFALKDIDTISQNTNFIEMKIKKIIQNANSQAQTNDTKTAMIYIENFDNFASNPLYGISSVYEQKAFSQLLSEMEYTRKNNDNKLIVIGSVNIPECLDENILKPYKFLNSIEVYPPLDANQTEEIINYYIDKMDISIEGSEKEIKQKIRRIAETSTYLSIVELMYLLETAKNIALEDKREKVDSRDLLEAYLQTTTGIANKKETTEATKKIVTSHETGHALNLQIMNEIARQQQIPWHLPPKLDFITLDPRGSYGGAMYSKPSENHEISFETIMSDIICSYGGYSAEKNIYNIAGSFGITADIAGVTNQARYAVMAMGMGKTSGVRAIPVNGLGSADVPEYKKKQIETDIDLMTKTGCEISDMIVKAYKDFILEFTEKHHSKVGSGDCIVTSDEFTKELNDWRKRQNSEKQDKLRNLNKEIVDKIQNIKAG